MAWCRQRAAEFQKKLSDSSKGGFAELVLFEDALLHLTRLCRVLSLDGASALLVGVGGSGKHSLARLAAFIAGDPAHHQAIAIFSPQRVSAGQTAYSGC